VNSAAPDGGSSSNAAPWMPPPTARSISGIHRAISPRVGGQHRADHRCLLHQAGRREPPVADPGADPAGEQRRAPGGGLAAVVVVVGRVGPGQEVEVVVEAPASVVGGRPHRDRRRVHQHAGGAEHDRRAGAAHADHAGVADRDPVVEVDREVVAGDRRVLRALRVRRAGGRGRDRDDNQRNAEPGHAGIVLDQAMRRTASTTAAGVIPSFSSTTSPGADAP
jgi:hypothetical protein